MRPTTTPQFSHLPTAVTGALTAGALLLLAGCGQAPVQSGNDHVPDINVEIAQAKDGKFATQAWPLVDEVMIGWLDGPFAPGCAVGVAIDDEVVYLKGYGRAVLGLAAEDWTVGTMGAVGSVSKTFTALAAMRQVEQGWLDIEEQTGDWLPVAGDLGDSTLFKLLSHTAGVGGGSRGAAFAPNWDADDPVDQCLGVDTPDPADAFCTAVHRLQLDPTWLAHNYNGSEANNVTSLPGVNVDGDPQDDGWEAIYSNVGYTVAGGVVGAVAQDHGYLGYEAYVWDAVGTWSANPLMPGQATSLALTHKHRATDIPNRAVGYFDANWGVGAKDWEPAEAWDTVSGGGHWIGPAGGWAATIGDLTRIVVAYRQNQIVSAASRNLMEFPIGYLGLGPDAENLPPYGLGMLVDDANGTVYHGGDLGVSNGGQLQSSHSGHWSWWPDALPGGTDVGVTMMCNNGKGSASLYSRAKDIVELLQETPASRPFSTQTHSTAPPPAKVQRGTWVLDTSAAYLVAPEGLPLAPSTLGKLALTTNLQRQEVSFARADSRGGAPRPSRLLGAVGAARLTPNGRLEASGGSLQLAVGRRTVRLRDVGVSFQVATDASRLADGVVAGTVDAREIAAFPGSPPVAGVCAAVRAAGESCGPCADGARACFPAALGGVTGQRLR
jgi:CubicO group peptidase (beta-lactamase class C family)